MKFFLFLLPMAFSLELKAALENPRLMTSLFQAFTKREHRHYANKQEAALRFALFRRAVKEINDINQSQDSYKTEVNFMADLTQDEREQYYGLNATLADTKVTSSVPDPIFPEDTSELDWTARNKIVPVKNQGSCGSCWSFSGTGALESRYAISTGALKPLSDQQGLDCSYEDRDNRNGCRGGWPKDVWVYVMRSGHFALESDYPYEAKDLKCRPFRKPNAITHATITSYTSIKKADTDDNLIYALLSGAVAVAFNVQPGFNYYKEGIYNDPSCPQRSPSHAVLATGYGVNYITIKNSWGTGWGDKGYIKFARIGNMCGVAGYAAIPILKKLKDEDDPKCTDKHRECSKWKKHCGNGEHWLYMAKTCPKTCERCRCDMSGCQLCKDTNTSCKTWARGGYCSKPNYKQFMDLYCPVSCNSCPKEDDEDEDGDNDGDERCGNGLVWCHGECQHEHFC